MIKWQTGSGIARTRYWRQTVWVCVIAQPSWANTRARRRAAEPLSVGPLSFMPASAGSVLAASGDTAAEGVEGGAQVRVA